jgi:serine/threonine protein kinase
VLDFGIAKMNHVAPNDSSATKTGIVMGTPTYMSPEQCKGAGTVDHRADLYSLGCILYEALCGVPPFEADGAGELIAMHLFVAPKPPRQLDANITPEAERLILELLAKDPAERPATAADVSRRLAALASGTWTATPATGVPIAQVTASHESQAARIPTTLSGAASQSIIEHPRNRRWLWLGIATVAVGATAFAIVSSSTKDDSSHAAGSAITRNHSASPPPPLPAPTPPAVAPKPTMPTPPPTPALDPDPKTVTAIAPSPAPSPKVKPVVKPPHHAVKPAMIPPEAGSAAPKILIEKDL